VLSLRALRTPLGILDGIDITHSSARSHTMRPLVLPLIQQPSARLDAEDILPPDL